MILNKRYRRNIKSNFSFYLCMTLLTLLAVTLDLVFTGVVDGEKNCIDSFQTSAYCEDGQFVTYNKILDEDIDSLEKEYNVLIEEQQYLNYEIQDDFRIRVVTPNEKINKHMVCEGEEIASNTDVMISTGLAAARGIKIGDTIKIGENNYNVSGFFARIDYLLMLETLSDSISNPSEFGLVMMSEEAFEEFDNSNVSSYYSVLYNSDNETEFRKAINEKYKIANYLKADNNTRINTAPTLIGQYSSICNLILPIMLICIMLLMAVIVGRKVKSEQRQIGVLLSLGYRRKELAAHYMLYGVIPGIVGAIVGAVIAFVSIPSLGEMLFAAKIEPLPVEFNISIVKLLVSLLAPAVVYGFFAWFKAFRIMKKDPIDMMRGAQGERHKNIFRMEKSKKSVKTKYMLRAVFGNISRTLIVVCGIAIGGFLLVYSFVCADSMRSYVDESVDNAGTFKYEYFLSSIQTDPVEDGVELLTTSFEVDGHNSTITLIGLDDTKFINDTLTDNSKMDLSKDNFYITSRGAIEFGVGKGDTLTVLDIKSLEEYDLKIAGVISNDSQNVIYMSMDEASKITGLPSGSYNAVMSEKELPYSGSEIVEKITTDEMKKQIENLTIQMEQLVYVMCVFGVFICVIAVYLMVNILLSENANVISMLKILGYRNKEINQMTTHIYHLLVPIGIVLGLIIGFYSTAYNFEYSVSTYSVYFKPYMTVTSVIAYVALVVVSYIISLALLSKKIKKADMTACLKNTNE